MPNLRMLLLGPPRLERNETPVEISRRKALALVVYLAMNQRTFSRDALATLFWPEADQSRARAALRQALLDLNRALGKSWLNISGDTLTIQSEKNLWSDVAAFRASLAERQSHGHPADLPCPACVPLLEKAVDLYRDDFLAGFTLPDCPDFDEWQSLQTEYLRAEFSIALERLIQYAVTCNDYEGAIPFARRWIALDPLLETPQRTLMQLYAWSGQRSAALRAYQEYTRLLAEELNLQADKSVRLLYERIRDGEEPVKTHKLADEFSPVNNSSVLSRIAAQPGRKEERYNEELLPVTVLNIGFSPISQNENGIAGNKQPGYEQLLQEVQKIAPRYQARLLGGIEDSVQILFGAERVHEDDPERAVWSALEIIEKACQHNLQASAGIATGWAYIAESSFGKFREVNGMGATLTLAARLKDKAQPGQILLNSSTYHQVQRAFEWLSQTIYFPGNPRPVMAYQVCRALPHPPKVRGLEGIQSEMIGRDDELKVLRRALDKLLTGQGYVVTIAGEAGVGKSRLVSELKKIALVDTPGEAKLQWLESRCFEFRSSTSYWPFIDLFHGLLSLNSEQFGEAHSSLQALLESMNSDGLLPPERQAEIGVIFDSLFSPIGALRNQGEAYERAVKTLSVAGPEQLRYKTFQSLRDFILALSHQRPLVLVFDDLHWADELSLDLISLLIESVTTYPIFLICIYRTEQKSKARRLETLAVQKCPGASEAIHLRDLTREQSHSLVCSLLEVDSLPPAVNELILSQSWGNPFFIEEAIRMLVDSNLLYRSVDGWRTRETPVKVTVPETLQSLVLSRFDRLPGDLKEVLRCAAVIGRSFDISSLKRVYPQIDELEDALWSLEESAWIYRERVVPEPEFSFKHALVHEIIYNILSDQHRAKLHQEIAEFIEGRYSPELWDHYEQLAYHYSRSPATKKAAEYLLKSGDKSTRAYLNNEAIRAFSQALTKIDELGAENTLELQVAALSGLGRTYYTIGEFPEAELYLLQAIEAGKHAGISLHHLVRLYYYLCEVLHWQGRYQDQIRLGEQGVDILAGTSRESHERILMNQTIAIGCYQSGEMELFHQLTDQSIQYIRRLPYSEELVTPFSHILLSLYIRKKTDELLSWIDFLKSLADEHHNLRLLGLTLEYRRLLKYASGDFSTIQSDLRQILELYQKLGDQLHIWRNLQGSVWLSWSLGDIEHALEQSRRAVEIAESLGFGRLIAESHLCLGMVTTSQAGSAGMAREAEAELKQAINCTIGLHNFWIRWAAPYSLGRLFLASGKGDQAADQFRIALEHFHPRFTNLDWYRLHWWDFLPGILNGLEGIIRREDFNSLLGKHSQPIRSLIPFGNTAQWGLEPCEPPAYDSRLALTSLTGPLPAGWRWVDPCADSTYHLDEGITITARTGRDLWFLNHTAPRLLHPAADDFIYQASCLLPAKPASGGLLAWLDKAHFMRLVYGARGPQEISFEGCIDGVDLLAGLGRLPNTTPDTRLYLVLERRGGQLIALCAAESDKNRIWYRVGEMSFPRETIQVGLLALGIIDRLAYPGDHPASQSIHFHNFSLVHR